MKILFSEIKKQGAALDWEGEYLKSKMADKECDFCEQVVNECSNDLSVYDVLSTFIYSKVDSGLLDRMPNLKLVVTRSTGFDHIDVQECNKRGIVVCNVPSYGENTVAEYAFTLLMTLGRKMYQANDRARKSNYDLEGLMGFDLMGKTLGVVGGGKIGQHAIRIGVGFGMKVICFDVNPNQSLAKEMSFEYVELNKLYQLSDIITLHVPLIPPTRHMVNKEAFDKMKEGVVLINTARGGVINTKDLVEALESGKLGGAGLDVLEGEGWLLDELDLVEKEGDIEKVRQALANHILMDNEKVVVTFHNAFNTKEGRIRILDATLNSIAGFAKKELVGEVVIKK